MEILQINMNMIETYSVMTIKSMIKNYDHKQWHEDLQNKSTLKFMENSSSPSKMNKNCMTTQQLLSHCLKLEVEPLD